MNKKSDGSSFTAPLEFHQLLNEAHWQLRKTKSEIIIEAVKSYLGRQYPNIKGDEFQVTGQNNKKTEG